MPRKIMNKSDHRPNPTQNNREAEQNTNECADSAPNTGKFISHFFDLARANGEEPEQVFPLSLGWISSKPSGMIANSGPSEAPRITGWECTAALSSRRVLSPRLHA
jgi:hypothetical protein